MVVLRQRFAKREISWNSSKKMKALFPNEGKFLLGCCKRTSQKVGANFSCQHNLTEVMSLTRMFELNLFELFYCTFKQRNLAWRVNSYSLRVLEIMNKHLFKSQNTICTCFVNTYVNRNKSMESSLHKLDLEAFPVVQVYGPCNFSYQGVGGLGVLKTFYWGNKNLHRGVFYLFSNHL